MGLLSFLLGSRSRPQPPRSALKPLPEISVDIEDHGFVDLTFAIRSCKTFPDGSQSLEVYGVHQGRVVGLLVVLGFEWKAVTLGERIQLDAHRGTVTYRSLGSPSDALIQALDQLYGTRLEPTTLRPSTSFTGISLAGEPSDLAKGPARIKLFFESDTEDRYAELYTNVDIANGRLEIREKDPWYRSAIIRALRAD
jgi:hypothetical protein